MTQLFFTFITCYSCFLFYDNILHNISSRYCCIGGHELSKTTGNAGGRVACGKHTHFDSKFCFFKHWLCGIKKRPWCKKLRFKWSLEEYQQLYSVRSSDNHGEPWICYWKHLSCYCLIGSNNLSKFKIQFSSLHFLIVILIVWVLSVPRLL
jgi:hypothetical protein